MLNEDFMFDNNEIKEIDKSLVVLKRRLSNDGIRKAPDGVGNFAEEPCSIFKDEELVCFLVNSLSEFNQMPPFTDFKFSDRQIQNRFLAIIVQGALLFALSTQALKEKGREWDIKD